MFSTIGYIICIPFAALLRFSYQLTQSYGVSLLLFTLVIKLIMLPFQMKSKRSMVRMSRMSGKMQEIQKKYANNQMKMNEEIQALYAEEGINPMSGCLWSFLPMPIVIALYYIIREPIVYFMNFGGRAAGLEVLEKAKEVVTSLGLGWTTLRDGVTAGPYAQIEILQHITNNADAPVVKQFLADNPGWVNVDYHFLGIDLTALPKDAFATLGSGVTLAALGLIMIPILSGVFSYLLSKVSMASSGTAATGSNKTVMLMMPLMSVWIGFIWPAALGVYWMAQSAFSIIQEVVLGRFYNQKIEAEETAKFEARQADRQRRMEEAKKLQEERERQAAQKRSLREKRQAALEAKSRKKPGTNEAGRVGDRPYARGRTYRADRYDDEE